MAPIDRKTSGEQVLSAINIAVLVLLTIIFLYPMWHCLMASFSDPNSLIGYRGFLFTPLGFSTEGYTTVLKNKNLLTGYGNTLLYTCIGSFINVMLTVIGGYCLSRKNMMFRRVVTLLIVFTMYVDFGLIPAFLNVRNLHLYDTRWALLLPEAIGTYNLIVMRTAFAALSPSLEESAMLDGATDITILFRILLPLTKATLAVVALFYAVGHWNSWYSAMIYLQDRQKFPLQLFLREILIANTQSSEMAMSRAEQTQHLDELIKYCSIIVSTLPILVAYPFAQKYFVTGVMVGSVKG
jgi:putative aldouronate transport system permease protein